MNLTPNRVVTISLKDRMAQMPQTETPPSQKIGGWTAGPNDLSQGKMRLNGTQEFITLGVATAPLTGIGIFIGKDGTDYEFRAGDPSGQYIHWDGSTLVITSTITGGTIQTATSGQRIRMVSASAATPTQAANSLMLINSSNAELLSFGSQSSVIMRILPTGTSQAALILQNDSNLQLTDNLFQADVQKANSSAVSATFSNAGTGNTVNITGTGTGKPLTVSKTTGTAAIALHLTQSTDEVGITLDKTGAGAAIDLNNAGTGYAIDVNVSNSSNANGALILANAGTGRSVEINQTNTSNTAALLFLANSGTGEAINLATSSNANIPAVVISNGSASVGMMRLGNMASDPTGSANVGDLAVVGGILKICTTAGNPGTWTKVGLQS